MRWLPRAIPVLITIIALDFALVFGFEGLRVLFSPIHGLDNTVFAGLVYGIGRFCGFGARGILAIAAFFGAIYLTIAIVLALHLATRLAALRGGTIAHDLLDAALILVVTVTIVAATPAILHGVTDILVQERLPLWLVGLAATLSMIERLPETDTSKPTLPERLWSRRAARRQRRDVQVVTPAIRLGNTVAARWDDLRTDAGMTIAAVPIVKSLRALR